MLSNAKVQSLSPADAESGAALDRRAKLALAVESITAGLDDVVANDGIDHVDEDVIQRLFTLGVKLYAARRAAGHDFLPESAEGSIDATEVAIATQGLLEAVNLDLFELSLWRHWGKP